MQRTTYTFIPEDPRAYYKRLVEIILKFQRRGENDSEELFPEDVREVLEECAFRWRVHPASRISLLLDVVKTMYEEEELDIDDIHQSFSMADSWDYASWPVADVLSQIVC